jgi:hypothetical protein
MQKNKKKGRRIRRTTGADINDNTTAAEIDL